MAAKQKPLPPDIFDFDEFLEHIAQGLGYGSYAQEKKISIAKLYRWIDSHSEGRARVDAAQEQAAQMTALSFRM